MTQKTRTEKITELADEYQRISGIDRYSALSLARGVILEQEKFKEAYPIERQT